jgi:hypothetical protein
MQHTEQHVMQLEKTFQSGSEEWYCPICERRFLLQWDPFKKVVLEQGDEYAIHSGGKGGLQLHSTNAVQNSKNVDEIDVEEEEVYLSEEWRNALNELDFGD